MGQQLKTQLEHLFSSTFPNSRTELRKYAEPGRIGGLLIWNGFDGVELIDRQNKLHDVINKGLDPKLLNKVASIFALTEPELRIMRDQD